MLDLLCISDLHLGEAYSFLDRTRIPGGDWKEYDRALRPFYFAVAELAGLRPQDEPKVRVHTLVLDGDVFELTTAKIETAARAGRNFFGWLFQWLEADEVIYIPGNHDHAFWMWWRCPPPSALGRDWWEADPQAVKGDLAKAYGGMADADKYSSPSAPEAPDGRQQKLLAFLFGTMVAKRARFKVGYPVYSGPNAAPPGYPPRLFRTLFTHGHLNDPTFTRPAEKGVVSLAMNVLSWGWGKKAKTGNLAELEGSTWEYTNRWWYPPNTNTTTAEHLYLFSTHFGDNNPCVHQSRTPPIEYPCEVAPDIKDPDASANDFYSLLHAALGPRWYLEPRLLVYGHTHHGGAVPLQPSVLVCNTGGWLTKVKDRPVHTHLFAIDDQGVAQMKRAGFRA